VDPHAAAKSANTTNPHVAERSLIPRSTLLLIASSQTGAASKRTIAHGETLVYSPRRVRRKDDDVTPAASQAEATATPVETWADWIKDGYASSPEQGAGVLATLLADVVTVVHDPPMPESDGPIERHLHVQREIAEYMQLRHVMTDFRFEDVDATVGTENAIVLTFALAGTLPTGPWRARVRASITVDGGWVVRILIAPVDGGLSELAAALGS
jgi:hypothetical protein